MVRKEQLGNITKLYISSKHHLTERKIYFLIMSHKCYPIAIKELTRWNWLVQIRYPDKKTLDKLLKCTFSYDSDVNVKRVFKSMTFRVPKTEPQISFLTKVAMNVSAIITKPVDIKIDNNRCNDWQKKLISIWQNELDKPDLFAKNNIKPVCDISQKGKLTLFITKGDNYVVTYFVGKLDKYIDTPGPVALPQPTGSGTQINENDSTQN